MKEIDDRLKGRIRESLKNARENAKKKWGRAFHAFSAGHQEALIIAEIASAIAQQPKRLSEEESRAMYLEIVFTCEEAVFGDLTPPSRRWRY